MAERHDSTSLSGPVSISGSGEEDARQLAGRLVNALYRLVKACQLHAETNQAVAQVVEYVVATVKTFEEKAGVSATAILFTPHAVFVNRQMLKASRETYQLAIELGVMLEGCDVTEVTLESGVATQDMMDFGRAVADASIGKKSPRFAEGGWETIKLRKVVGLGANDDMSPPVRAARTYAAALMILRGFYADLKKGKYELRQGIKRVAQKLVSSFDGNKSNPGGRLLLSIAAAPTGDADRSNILLSTSILALAMGNQITNDRALLTALTSAGLLYDAGRQRLVGYQAEATEASAARTLNADEESMVPVSTVVALTALGKLHPPNIARSVIAHEAQALRDGGQVYQGRRSPLLLSRILSVARAFTELRVPRPGTSSLGIDEALQVLESQAPDNVGRALVKLLMGSLGIFPAGTMVELSTGEMGVVLSTPLLPIDFARPPVRVLYDTSAQLLAEPIDLDLAAPLRSGEPRRFIRRAIDATDQQMKQMRAYVMQLATKRARKKSLEKMQAVDPSNTPLSQQSFGSHGSALSSSFSSSSSAHSASAQSAGSAQSQSRGSQPFSDRPSSPDSGDLPPLDSQRPRASSAGPSSPRVEAPVASSRPHTRRWDPRSEDASPRPASAAAQGIIAPSPSSPNAAQSSPQQSPGGGKPNIETRSVNWQEYGRELANVVAQATDAAAESAPGSPRSAAFANRSTTTGPFAPPSSSQRNAFASRPTITGPTAPPSSQPTPNLNETDAILAAYLQEGDAGNAPPQGDDPGSAARSFGLRWTGKNPLHDSTIPPSQQSAPRGSSQGAERDSSSGGGSNAGLRWGTPVSQNRENYDEPPSVPAPKPTPSRRVATEAHPTPPRPMPQVSMPARPTPAQPIPAAPASMSAPSRPAVRTAAASSWATPSTKTPAVQPPSDPVAQPDAPPNTEAVPSTEGPMSKRSKATWSAPRRDKR